MTYISRDDIVVPEETMGNSKPAVPQQTGKAPGGPAPKANPNQKPAPKVGKPKGR